MAGKDTFTPLAERCRPETLDDFIGQEHLVGEGKIIRTIIERETAFSMVLWGDPGSGKTTLAMVIARHCAMAPYFLSAISAGVADVRRVIDKGRENRAAGIQTLLFLDEIHRFNKAQQDAVLGAVESGDIVLIGATTENPSFSIIAPLLSRTRVVRLKSLSENDLLAILDNAIERDEILTKGNIRFEEGVKDRIIFLSGGDARRMFNIVETSFLLSSDGLITEDNVKEAVKNSVLYYDKAGDRHYDTISAFIKSIRGSDPDAAVYYLARMILAGEDAEFIARRMVILASEDIGNASPVALNLAVSTMTAVKNIGLPEAEIILSHCAIFLASCPKSNAACRAIGEAKASAEKQGVPIPLHLRNAPTGLMKKMGYGKDYRYPHNFPGHFVHESYLPPELGDVKFYEPSEEGNEKALRDRLRNLWPERYRRQ